MQNEKIIIDIMEWLKNNIENLPLTKDNIYLINDNKELLNYIKDKLKN